MGNALSCCQAATTVRVYHGDNGHLLKFSCRPIPSVRLMREHPNYLIVYSIVQVVQSAATTEGQVSQLRQQVHIRVVQPGDLLEVGQAYFLLYVPGQHRRAFAKYFIIARRSSSSPAASPLSRHNSSFASPLYSPVRSTQSIRNASPLHSPTWSPRSTRPNRIPSPRSFVRRATSTPRSPLAPSLSTDFLSPLRSGGTPETVKQSIYTPSPLRGSPRRTTRAENERHPEQHSPLNSEKANRVSSPGGLSSSSKEETYESIIGRNIRQNRKTLASMINEDIQRSPSRSMESPQRVISPPPPPQPQVQGTQKRISYSNLQQRNPGNILMRSPVRAIALQQGSLRNILYHNLQQRSPASRSMQRMPGTPTRNFNLRPRLSPKGSSSYYLNKSPHRPSQFWQPGKPEGRLSNSEMLFGSD